ncbi:MAG TPA: molecular chaperone DnaJ [Polyangiaceae bacterium]
MSDEQNQEVCSTCGGDRRISNSFGLTTTCPSCHGSGRRAESTGFHDVTKTKPSHYKPTNRAGEPVAKPQWPTTGEGGRLATEVRDSKTVTEADKARLIREIIDYEQSHGQCTQTFSKKVRKQVRPRTA